MRSSFVSLLSLYTQRNVPERLTLEGTKWLDHIKLLLISGSKVAKIVDEEGASVLVHCSDGWDRTAQLSSLAQVLLVPYYRAYWHTYLFILLALTKSHLGTMEGFCALVQKEWLSFGHKFNDRLGHGIPEELATESSPIFLQFLGTQSNGKMSRSWINRVIRCRVADYVAVPELFRVQRTIFNRHFGQHLQLQIWHLFVQ